MTTTAPYGTWPSPISAAAAVSSGTRFADVIRIDGDDVYWIESRPDEGGRSVIVRRTPDGEIEDAVPGDFNARTRVHEYGGAAYSVVDGVVYAASFDDQRWYRIDRSLEPSPITPPGDKETSWRFADLEIRGSWAVAVRETHEVGRSEPKNDLVRIDLTGVSEPVVLVSGHDFFAAPRISPDGNRIAWLTWDHPSMPWDETTLWLGSISPDGLISNTEIVEETPHVSIVQPEWSPDGTLHFAADHTGWWNIYRWDAPEAVPIHRVEAEFAHESWQFGLRRYGFLADGSIVAAAEGTDGDDLLVLGAELRTISTPFSTLGGSVELSGRSAFAVGSSFDRPARLVQIDIETGSVDTIQAPADPEFMPGFASIPEQITFATPDGDAHALYYPPTHPDFTGPASDLPPAIVTIHGGPTARIGLSMSAERLFWTSRGFGVLDVDYGGSTGHGREYRQRLTEQWGVVDVRDCALAAEHLAETDRADADRLVIQGGSAGGFTVLMALALHDVFAAGVARYPVTNLETLAGDTHKFESRYLDSLVGPYPATKDRYVERSPTTHVARINAAVLLMQGLDDRVVPPSQPRAMQRALLEQGVPVGYLEFEGEGHGFRAATTRIRSLEAELSFYAQVFDFEPSDVINPIDIAGL